MSSNKTLALALCLAITGCAQTPQNDAAGGHKWWQMGSSDQPSAAADKGAAAKPADTKVTPPVAKTAAAPAPAATPARTIRRPAELQSLNQKNSLRSNNF